MLAIIWPQKFNEWNVHWMLSTRHKTNLVMILKYHWTINSATPGYNVHSRHAAIAQLYCLQIQFENEINTNTRKKTANRKVDIQGPDFQKILVRT